MGVIDDVKQGLVDRICGAANVRAERVKLVPLARGRVLELGIGSGLNLPLYDASAVEQLIGLDPDARSLARAEKRSAETSLRTELVRGSAEAIPFDARSIDTALITFSLCSIPDPAAALREVRRVLKADGKLLFLEHGLAPDASVARWQHWLTPVWRRVAGGCHLDRDVPALLSAAGFTVDELVTQYLPGLPKILGHGFRGAATISGVL